MATRGARGGPILAIGPPRARSSVLSIAITIVVGLHAGMLFLRLDVAGAGPSSARAMAVRFLPSNIVEVPPAGPDFEPARRETERSREATPSDPGEQDVRTTIKPAERRSNRASVAAEPRVEPLETSRPSSPASAAALAPEPDYLSGGRLDPGPRPLGTIEPEYPELAHLQEGKVVLRLLISETGMVDNVAIVRAEPNGVFEEAALDAFRVARFSPGMVLGTPVKSQITVEVEFLPINRGARISGRMY
jgi:protein TonB